MMEDAPAGGRGGAESLDDARTLMNGAAYSFLAYSFLDNPISEGAQRGPPETETETVQDIKTSQVLGDLEKKLIGMTHRPECKVLGRRKRPNSRFRGVQ